MPSPKPRTSTGQRAVDGTILAVAVAFTAAGHAAGAVRRGVETVRVVVTLGRLWARR